MATEIPVPEKALTLSREGWLYRLAYLFTHPSRRPAEATDLCSLVWRLLGVTFVTFPMFVLWLPLGFALGFLGAARPRFVFWDGHAWPAGRVDCIEEMLGWLFVSYSRWPTVNPGGGKVRIWPLLVLIGGGLAYFVLISFWGRIALAIAVSTAGVIYFFECTEHGKRLNSRMKERRGDTGALGLAVAYVKGKKRGICPLVRIV